jgi:3-deoxy-manno-octulosonate cytidylyltransferase (CMP-KDO synthetase)
MTLLVFSRSVIPYPEKNVGAVTCSTSVFMPSGNKPVRFFIVTHEIIEASEKLEQLRYLEFGKRIKMVETTHVGIGIDTLKI